MQFPQVCELFSLGEKPELSAMMLRLSATNLVLSRATISLKAVSDVSASEDESTFSSAIFMYGFPPRDLGLNRALITYF